MSDIVSVYYNGNLVKPIVNINHSNNIVYNNDTTIGYSYNVTLRGVCTLPETENADYGDLASSIKYIKEVFSSNGAKLTVVHNNKLILFAVDSKIQSLSFEESGDNWSRTVPYTVVIEFNHLHMGDDLANDPNYSLLIQGYDDPSLIDYMHTPFMVDVESHKIKSFDESFNMDISDENIHTLTLIKPLAVHDYTTIPGISQNYITNTFFNINYTLSAVGKHHVKYDNSENKLTLPAWEHAKRWVHRRLAQQITGMFSTFMNGSFYMQNPLGGEPSFGLFNENYVIDVSESDGKYSIQYSATVKQRCPSTEFTLGCSDNAIHEISKSISRQIVANEETNLENQEITITIDGSIRGLLPSKIGISPIFIDNPEDGFNRGSFLVRQNTIYDRNDYADQLLSSIFDPFWYDFTEPFKRALGITPDVFAVNQDVILRPSKMNLTRNFLEGTINYNAEYNNKYNCLESHYEVTLSVEMPVPVIAEFTIPNNNVEDTNDEVCASGYSVIQKLGTQTAKKITVNINGNPGFDLGKCCLGSYNPIYGCQGNLDIYDLSYFSLGDFVIPSGVVIPIIGNDYVLTNKQKKTNFPKGDFNITLEYICADVCEVEYFDDKSSAIIN